MAPKKSNKKAQEDKGKKSAPKRNTRANTPKVADDQQKAKATKKTAADKTKGGRVAKRDDPTKSKAHGNTATNGAVPLSDTQETEILKDLLQGEVKNRTSKKGACSSKKGQLSRHDKNAPDTTFERNRRDTLRREIKDAETAVLIAELQVKVYQEAIDRRRNQEVSGICPTCNNKIEQDQSVVQTTERDARANKRADSKARSEAGSDGKHSEEVTSKKRKAHDAPEGSPPAKKSPKKTNKSTIKPSSKDKTTKTVAPEKSKESPAEAEKTKTSSTSPKSTSAAGSGPSASKSNPQKASSLDPIPKETSKVTRSSSVPLASPTKFPSSALEETVAAPKKTSKLSFAEFQALKNKKDLFPPVKTTSSKKGPLKKVSEAEKLPVSIDDTIVEFVDEEEKDPAQLRGIANWKNACFGIAALQFLYASFHGHDVDQYLGVHGFLNTFGFDDARCMRFDKARARGRYQEPEVAELQGNIRAHKDKHPDPSFIAYLRQLIALLRTPPPKKGPKHVSAMRFHQLMAVRFEKTLTPAQLADPSVEHEPSLDGQDQQDSRDFFGRILDVISAEQQSTAYTDIKDLFCQNLRVEQRCLKKGCPWKHTSQKATDTQMWHSMTITDHQNRAVDDMYTSSLSGPNEKECPTCKAKFTHETITVVGEMPDNFIFHINRFGAWNPVGGGTARISGIVTYPTEITINKTRYQLKAFVTHDGMTAESGHYKAHMEFQGTWKEADDREIRKSSFTKEKTSKYGGEAAMLVLYQKMKSS